MESNIFDYIKWRGDLSFEDSPFCEVDSVIFSLISYLNLNGIVSADFEKKGISLETACQKFFDSSDFEERSKIGLFFDAELLELFKKISVTNRYKNIKLCGFVDSLDFTHEKQFSAFTAMLEDETVVVTFRGTDDTLVGWKEDFNMAFTTPVPSQKEALEYLENLAKKLLGKIILTGHSKGGNLSVFASTFCSDRIKRRIHAVYNNDGPGFEYDITQLADFQKINDKLHTFIPQTSIVGMLLEHEEDYIIVKSNEIGIMQHNPFSWQLDGPAFLKLEKMTEQGVLIDKTIKKWLQDMDKTQRETFVEALFELLASSDATTLTELAEKWKRNPASSLRSLFSLDEKTRHIVWKTIEHLFKIARQNIPTFSELISKVKQ